MNSYAGGKWQTNKRKHKRYVQRENNCYPFNIHTQFWKQQIIKLLQFNDLLSSNLDGIKDTKVIGNCFNKYSIYKHMNGNFNNISNSNFWWSCKIIWLKINLIYLWFYNKSWNSILRNFSSLHVPWV